ncbi:MAG: hypothetical protein Q7R91_03075 [bacterium]|nr:hypothetical protein [bacterium]
MPDDLSIIQEPSTFVKDFGEAKLASVEDFGETKHETPAFVEDSGEARSCSYTKIWKGNIME